MIAAITSIVVGAISYGVKAAYASNKSAQLKQEAKDNMEITKTNQKYLTDQYEAAKKYADWDWDNTQNMLGQNIAVTKQNQLTNAQINALRAISTKSRRSRILRTRLKAQKLRAVLRFSRPLYPGSGTQAEHRPQSLSQRHRKAFPR
jgi:hypothetical protein